MEDLPFGCEANFSTGVLTWIGNGEEMGVLKRGRKTKTAVYHGKQAKTGNSLGLCSTFLSFLAADIAHSPQQIQPLDWALTERIDAVVGHLPANPYEELGDEPLV